MTRNKFSFLSSDAKTSIHGELWLPEGPVRAVLVVSHGVAEYILRYWDKHSPDYRQGIFDDGTPYDIEYFQWFVPCLKDKALAGKLTSVLCQNPTAFMELDYAKSDGTIG